MAFGIPGITAPPQTAASNPIDALNLPNAKPPSSAGGASKASTDSVSRSDATTNSNAYHDAIARLGGAATIAAHRVGSALPEVSETIGNVATKAVGAAAPVLARVSGVASAAVIVLTPANANQYGHEQLPGETEKHWLERTDPKLAAYVAHPPESRVHVTPVDDEPKSAIASRTPARSAAAFPNHTGHSTASPQIATHTGHTSAAPPADSVSTTPITHTEAADHALFAKKTSSSSGKSAPGRLTVEAEANPNADESKVASELIARGRNVSILAPSKVGKRPDFLVDGKLTELKTLSNAKVGKAASTLTSTIVRATKQADRIIVDARDQRGLTEAKATAAVRNAVRDLPKSQIKEVHVMGREGNRSYDVTVTK